MAVQAEIKGGKLVITVDVSDKAIANARPSGSGKTKLVATTSGFSKLSDTLSFSLNVTTPNIGE